MVKPHENNRTDTGVACLGAYLQSIFERPLQVALNLLVLNGLQT